MFVLLLDKPYKTNFYCIADWAPEAMHAKAKPADGRFLILATGTDDEFNTGFMEMYCAVSYIWNRILVCN